jgi:hypothetical protein
MVMCRYKRLGMRRLSQREAYKQASEQQNFVCEKQPHPDLGGIELLLERREVML